MKMKLRFNLIIFLPVVLLAITLIIFLARTPVLIVSDQNFNDLYGRDRAFSARIRSSITLFRQVRLVTLAEDIGPDGITFAVSEISENPFCVCFPHRYAGGAVNYNQQFPQVKTALFTGRESYSGSSEQLTVIQTDTETDMYRAGLIAAIIAEGSPGKILCYTGNRIQTPEKYFFELGLKDGGREGEAVFIGTNEKYSGETTIACVVVTGSTDDPFITKQNIPIILFSWGDTYFFPSQVKIIFSDSIWEMAVPTVKMLQKEENITKFPSNIRINPKSGVSSDQKRQLKSAFSKNRPLIK